MRALTVHWQILALALAACGAPEETTETGTTRGAVIGGTTDAGHPEVLGIFIQPALSTGVGFCSGFLIAPNLLMTARHCVSDMDKAQAICADETVSGTQYTAVRALAPAPAANFGVTTEDNIDNLTSPSQLLQVSAVHVPSSASGQPNCGTDVALLELKSPTVGIPVVPLRADAPVVDEKFTAVGYGYDGAVAGSDGIRRSRSGLSVMFVGEVRNSSGRIAATANDWVATEGPCGGDSGGPALDTNGAVIGVMSRGNPTVCKQMIYTQVGSFRAWAKQVVKDAAGRGGIPVAAWAADPVVDAGPPDAGPVDAGAVDAGSSDSGIPDAGPAVDAGVPSSVPLATINAPAAPMGCSATSGFALIGALALLRKRRD